MPKRSSKDNDPNLLASDTLDKVIAKSSEEPRKNPAAVALGKLGGKKGGPARAKKLSPERRKEIAKKAAQARWGKKK